jgi:hypothetical protein
MSGLPDLSNVPGILPTKEKPTIRIVGKAAFDRGSIAQIFQYLYKDTVNPQTTPYINNRLDILPHYQSSADRRALTTTAGYIYWPSLKICYVAGVGLDSTLRRHGIITAMCDYYRAEVKKAGVTDLYTQCVSQEGQALMVARGWEFFNDLPLRPKFGWGHIKI